MRKPGLWRMQSVKCCYTKWTTASYCVAAKKALGYDWMCQGNRSGITQGKASWQHRSPVHGYVCEVGDSFSLEAFRRKLERPFSTCDEDGFINLCFGLDGLWGQWPCSSTCMNFHMLHLKIFYHSLLFCFRCVNHCLCNSNVDFPRAWEKSWMVYWRSHGFEIFSKAKNLCSFWAG